VTTGGCARRRAERTSWATVVRRAAGVLVVLSSTTIRATGASAQEHIPLPPVNLGGTSFLDGAGGPGLLVREALGAFDAPHFADASGATVPGQNTMVVFTSTTLVGYMAPFEVLGGNWGVEVLVPLVTARLTTPSGTATSTGVGDITFSGLVWQAPPLRLAGRRLLQRLDLDIVAPTGQYADGASLTAGSHLWSVNPYYAFTWLAADRIETSWRIHYLWNSANNVPSPAYEASSIQPGQAVHLNGAASFAIIPEVRVGVAGYFLRQITDSKANGRSVPGSQEQVAALGPGFLVNAGSLMVVANVFDEFAVENRPRGIRAGAVVMKVW
jgi:hypothetical protein